MEGVHRLQSFANFVEREGLITDSDETQQVNKLPWEVELLNLEAIHSSRVNRGHKILQIFEFFPNFFTGNRIS